MSTADPLGSVQGKGRAGWRKPVGCVELAMTHRSASRCVFATHPTCWRPGNVACPQRSTRTCSLAPRPQTSGRELGLFSGSIPPWFVLSNDLSITNTRAIWLCFGAFLSPPAPCPLLHGALTTGHYSPASRSTRASIRRDQRGQVVRRPYPAGYCLTPTADLPKTERDPISTNGHSIFIMSPNQAIPAEKSNRSSPLATTPPLTILSWPEALNASGSRRACRMAIRRNACSLLALPDFPGLAQAVRFGVPGTPGTMPQAGLSSRAVPNYLPEHRPISYDELAPPPDKRICDPSGNNVEIICLNLHCCQFI